MPFFNEWDRIRVIRGRYVVSWGQAAWSKPRCEAGGGTSMPGVGGGLFAPGAGRVASERGPLCGASAHFYFVIKHFWTLWGIYDVYRNKVVHVCVVCLCSVRGLKEGRQWKLFPLSLSSWVTTEHGSKRLGMWSIVEQVYRTEPLCFECVSSFFHSFIPNSRELPYFKVNSVRKTNIIRKMCSLITL